MKSLSLELALPSTGRVRLSWLSLAAAELLGPWPGLRTVTVFPAGSVEMITALIFALLLLIVELDVCCDVCCLASASVSVAIVELLDVVEP